MREWMKFLGSFLIFILALPLTSAQELELGINKYTFEPGENINITANISNPLPQELVFISILSYEGKSNFSPRAKSFIVSKFEEKTIKLYFIEVKDYFPSGKYSVIASLVQNENLLVSKNLTFEITNTKPSFEFEVMTCRDKDCSNKSKVFVKGESIYLDYVSKVSTPEVNATLSYPDKTIKQLTLPTSIKAEQTGTYTLKVTASKEGYKTKTLSTQFGVVEKEAEIINTSSCFVNSKCEPDLGENYKTCPQDCEPCAKDNICNPDCLTGEDADCKQTAFPYWLLIIGLVIALFLLIILVRHVTDRL